MHLLCGSDGSGASTVRGRIEGRPVYAYCTDATRMGCAIGLDACRYIADAIDAAVRDRCPIIDL